jgi:hypothetical protein
MPPTDGRTDGRTDGWMDVHFNQRQIAGNDEEVIK